MICSSVNRRLFIRLLPDEQTLLHSGTNLGEQTIAYKAHRRTLIHCFGLRKRLALECTNTLSPAAPYRQPSLTVQPTGQLAIHRPTFASQQNVHTTITIGTTHSGDLTDTLSQVNTLWPARSIVVERLGILHQPTCTRHTEAALAHQHRDHLAPCLWAYHSWPGRSFNVASSSYGSASSRFSLLFSASILSVAERRTPSSQRTRLPVAEGRFRHVGDIAIWSSLRLRFLQHRNDLLCPQ